MKIDKAVAGASKRSRAKPGMIVWKTFWHLAASFNGHLQFKIHFTTPEKILHGCFALPRILKQGASGIEPPTSRSAVECSTTELRSLKARTLIFQNVLFKTMLLASFIE